MKVKREDVKGSFVPFNLVISIESEEEARAMYAIFSHTGNTRLLKLIDSGRIREEIGDIYSCSKNDKLSIISNGISYKQFYNGWV